MTRAVVFAYHNVGVRCLSTLLAQGVEVALVVTHEDNPDEHIWFDSVARIAELNHIPIITPEDPNTPDVVARIRELAPDFLFSFYYRHMLGAALLDIPTRGALNMHGSLLPKYRGRVPVNWAIIHGEKEAGASLHYMEIKPDAGDLAGQLKVPVLPNDTADQVFEKISVAAELVLSDCLPGLIHGSLKPTPLKLEQGSYFGGRRPEDGRIDWEQTAWQIHNLIRAVAPPYPGASTTMDGHHARITGSYFLNENARHHFPCIYRENDTIHADCSDGRRFRITGLEISGHECDAAEFERLFGDQPIPTGELE
jgi:methionyl-tRNA formyltransferase